MADSAATVNSSETAKSKDAVILFSKLHSFQQAKCEVQIQLEAIIGKDQMVEIIPVWDYGKTFPKHEYKTVTAVVVIDARQTRTLITPSRRDANVDHWDELERLEPVTEPKGSILLVIYGDEASKEMENKLVADKWLSVWKFNDEYATMFVKNNRCFTLWNKFNPEQEKQIKQYIYTLPFLPIYNNHFNILVVGDKEKPSGKYHDRYLKLHPFYDLSERKDGNGKYAKIHVYEYQCLNITKTSKKPPPESFKVHYTNDDTINICDKDQDGMNNELERLKRDLISKEDTFQNSIVFSHCMSCVKLLKKKFSSEDLQAKHCKNMAHIYAIHVATCGLQCQSFYQTLLKTEKCRLFSVKKGLTYIVDATDPRDGTWEKFVREELQKRLIVSEGITLDSFDSKLLWFYGLYIGNQMKVSKDFLVDKCIGQNIAVFVNCEHDKEEKSSTRNSPTMKEKIKGYIEHDKEEIRFTRNFLSMMKKALGCKKIEASRLTMSATSDCVHYSSDLQINFYVVKHTKECEAEDLLATIITKGTFKQSTMIHGAICLIKHYRNSEDSINKLLKKVAQKRSIIPVFVILVSDENITEEQLKKESKLPQGSSFYFIKFPNLVEDIDKCPEFLVKFYGILSKTAENKDQRDAKT